MQNRSLSLQRSSRGWAAALATLVAILAIPSAAGAANAGGMAVAGSMQYGNGGVPRLLTAAPPACKLPVTFHVSAGALVIDTPAGRYAGPVTISNDPDHLIAGGEPQEADENVTDCESFLLGGGGLSLDLSGKNEVSGAQIECDNVDGTWIRVFSAIEIGLNGRCEIGNVLTKGRIVFIGAMSHVPNGLDLSGDVTHPYITSAAIGGTLAVG